MSSNPNTYEFHSPDSLDAVAAMLPEAMEVPIFREDPDADDDDFMSEIETHKGVANPANGDLYGVVTSDYEVINPTTFLDPLVEGIRERERADVRGFFNVYDDGAYGFGELLFDEHAIWPPDRSRTEEPVRIGMTVRYSHDGGISVRASGFSQDGMCKNTMHRVTDSVYVKHAGDVEGRVDWEAEWGTVLDQLGVFSERLAGIIEQSMEFELYDLTSSTFGDNWVDATDPNDAIEGVSIPGLDHHAVRGLHGFYDYLGLPNYLALASVDRLAFRLPQTDDARRVSAWDAYSAVTYALTHHGRFEAGSSSYDDYHRIASDILLNPARALEEAQRGFHDRTTADAAADDPFAIESTVGEALAAYEERERQMRAAMQSESED